jgi:predicted component of type VI protein secretion system
VNEEAPIEIPLQEHRFGRRTATITADALRRDRLLLIVESPSLPPHELRRRFQDAFVIRPGDASAQQLAEASPLAHIGFSPVRQPVTQPRFPSSAVQFELDRTSPTLDRAGQAVAIHIMLSGFYDDDESLQWLEELERGLRITLWAVSDPGTRTSAGAMPAPAAGTVGSGPVRIPLVERRYGVYVGLLQDKTPLKSAVFILAVRSHAGPDPLRRTFMDCVRIGPVEQIVQLVHGGQRGIGLSPLAVPPPQLASASDWVHFELDRAGADFEALATSAAIAVHVSGTWPALDMDLWAVHRPSTDAVRQPP